MAAVGVSDTSVTPIVTLARARTDRLIPLANAQISTLDGAARAQISLLRTHVASLAAKLPSPLTALLALQGRLGTLQGKLLLSLEDRGTRLLLAAGLLCAAPIPLIVVYRAGRRPPSPTPMIEEVSAELAEELLSAYAAETAAKPVDPRSPAAESPQTVTEAELQSPPPAAAATPTERRLHGVAEHLQAEVASSRPS